MTKELPPYKETIKMCVRDFSRNDKIQLRQTKTAVKTAAQLSAAIKNIQRNMQNGEHQNFHFLCKFQKSVQKRRESVYILFQL